MNGSNSVKYMLGNFFMEDLKICLSDNFLIFGEPSDGDFADLFAGFFCDFKSGSDFDVSRPFSNGNKRVGKEPPPMGPS